MIEFNLLPKDTKGIKVKKLALKVKLPKIAPTPLIIAVISIVTLSQLTLGVLAITQRSRLIKLSTDFNEISSQEEMALALQKEANELSRKSSVVEVLTSGNLIWAKKLYDLNQAMIDGVWLTSLFLKEEEPQEGPSATIYTQEITTPDTTPANLGPVVRQTIVLTGSVISPSPGGEPAIIGKFIESLRNNKGFFRDFGDIKLSSVQRKKLGEIEVMDFTIVCYFKSGRSYFEKLEARDL